MHMRLLAVIYTCFVCYSSAVYSQLTSQEIDGTYTTLMAERGKGGQPTNTILMQLAELNGQQVLVTAGCHPGCSPIIYRQLKEPSRTLNRAVFFSNAGLYLFQVDANSFVVAMPDAELGKQVWQNLKFVNVYSKQGQTLPFDQTQATAFALQQSQAIMNTGTLTAMSHGSGQYHLAAPIKVLGKPRETAQILFSDAPDKALQIKPCDKCPVDRFNYLKDESSLTGTPIYANKQGKIILDVKDGVLIWADFKGNFGKTEWQENYHFNVYAKDIGYIRGVRSDQSKQQAVDTLINEHANTVKAAMDERAAKKRAKKIANQTLPAKGLRDKALEKEITQAAKRWANAWQWKETIAYAYFNANGWRTKHHPLTGLITGRVIPGIVVMKRPDGMCSFHYVTFGQDYDGNHYSGTHMVGLVPGQYQLSCAKI